ncbi:MAG: hypothetical protein EBS32_08060 [Actinobacteria bacterium]|nr:hypothetical protein [Actinomycetota bacterium]
MLMVTEPERLELHQAMRGLIGTGPANTFMQLATPRDWDDVVRVHQLDAAIGGLRSELKQDITEVRLEIGGLRSELKQDITDVRLEIGDLRSELKQDIADVRLEIAGLRDELKQEITDLRTEVRTGFAEMRTEMTLLISTEIRRQTQWIIGVLTSLSVALILATLL